MANDFDWKKFEFITTVQTGMIHNAVNLSLETDAIKRRAEFSSTTAIYQMAEAFRAAERIPENVTARQAAHAFTHWLLRAETDPGAKMPSWFGPPTPEDEERWERGED